MKVCNNASKISSPSLDSRDAYSVRDARARLGGISNGKFYDLVNSGQLRTFLVGRRRLVSQQAIQNFIQERENQSQEFAERGSPAT